MWKCGILEFHIMAGSHALFASVFLLCFCLTQNEYSSHYRFTSFVTKSAVILSRLAPEKESGFSDFEDGDFEKHNRFKNQHLT